MSRRMTLLVTAAVFLSGVRCVGDSEVAPIAKRATGGTAGVNASGGASGSFAEGGVSGSLAEGGVGGDFAEGGAGGELGSGGAFGSDGAGGFGARGGVSGNGGLGGSGVVGGAGGTGGGFCPLQRPRDSSDCSDVPPLTSCAYGDSECVCLGGQLGGGWNCFECPNQRPQNGTQCGSGPGQPGERCFYGPTQCACIGGNWSCGECPNTTPTENAQCESVGLACRFGSVFCLCAGGPGGPPNWDCFGGGPPDGGAFGGAGGSGASDGGNPICPPEEPPNNSGCGVQPGTQCNYGNRQCRCFGGSWRC